VPDPRAYPDRPYLAVSAAILHDGRVLLVRRARNPAQGLFSLPGGGVEAGETLFEAVIREVQEETGLLIEPFATAGQREVITRDAAKRIERHFVIVAFAARWIAGELSLNEELTEARWVLPGDVPALPTTEGLAEVVAAAFEQLRTRT
jgi:ADP-ribose pyrophosphatase YjhB (NUDIX family)